MIFDKTLMFSQEQTINGVSTISTNIVDLGPVGKGLKRDIGKGGDIPILVQAVGIFNGTGTVQVFCDVSDNEVFPTYYPIWSSPAYSTVNIKVGDVFVPESVTRGVNRRYMRLRYVGSAAGITGKITAGITMGNQSNG